MIDRTAYLWYVLGEAHDEEHGRNSHVCSTRAPSGSGRTHRATTCAEKARELAREVTAVLATSWQLR